MRDVLEELRRRTEGRPPQRPFPTPPEVRRALASIRQARPVPQPGDHPWIPEPFVGREEQWREQISAYVAVDDIDEGMAVFSATRWPTLDGRHRLVFDEGSAESFALPVPTAQAFLNRYRVVEEVDRFRLTPNADPHAAMQRRQVRVGDVFAMSSGALEALRDPAIVDAPGVLVIDVTRHAREAAKIAFYAAAVRTIDPEASEDRELAETI